MGNLELKTKQTYKTKEGILVKIVGFEKGDNCRIYLGDNGRRYFPDGTASSIGVPPDEVGDLTTFVANMSLFALI